MDERKRFVKAQQSAKLAEDSIEIEKCRQMIQAEKLQMVKQKERERAKLESIMVENEVRRKKMAVVPRRERAILRS